MKMLCFAKFLLLNVRQIVRNKNTTMERPTERKPKSLRSYKPIYRYQNRLKSSGDAGVTYSIFFESMILGENTKCK